jgi:hypothetical protein
MAKPLSVTFSTFEEKNYGIYSGGLRILGKGTVTYSDHKEYEFTAYSNGNFRLFCHHGRNGYQRVNAPKREELLRAHLAQHEPSAFTPDMPTPTPTPPASHADQLIALQNETDFLVYAEYRDCPDAMGVIVRQNVEEKIRTLGVSRDDIAEAISNSIAKLSPTTAVDTADTARAHISLPTPKRTTRDLLVEMCGVVSDLLGTCELNLDELEDNTVSVIETADALLDEARSHLAHNRT